MELEKAMSYFENEQLETTESRIPGIIEEAEKHNKSIRNEILALNLWGRKWNLIVHGIAGEIKETSKATRHKIQECTQDVWRVIRVIIQYSIRL